VSVTSGTDGESEDSKFPLVSVVIPTLHTKWSRLETCLLSIQNQKYGHHEVIVIDSSNDNYAEAMSRKFGAKYIRMIVPKAAARNIGTSVSRGQLVLHLDADMVLARDVLSECANEFRNGSQAMIIPEIVEGKGFLAECRKLEKMSCRDNSAMEAARCVTRELHDRIGGFDNHTGNIDEFAYHAKIERTRCKIVSTVQPLLVAEPIFDLSKKFGHGRYFKFYKKSYGWKARQQFSPVERVRSYFRVAKRKPAQLLVMLLLKGLDCVAFMLGAAASSIHVEDEERARKPLRLRRGFDKLGSRYESRLLASSGGALISRIETGAIQSLSKVHRLGGKANWGKQLALDIGCGPGRLSGVLLSANFRTVGIDVSHEMCKASMKRYRQADFEAICADARYLPLKPNTFDHILCFRMIKYAGHPEEIIRETRRVIAPQGRLVLEIPNHFSPFYMLGKAYSKFIGGNHPLGVFNYLMRSKLFTLKACRLMMNRCGFKEKRVDGLFFLPQALLARSEGKLSRFLWAANNLVAGNPRSKLFSRSFLLLAQATSPLHLLDQGDANAKQDHVLSNHYEF